MPSTPRRILILADRIDGFDAARVEAWAKTWGALGFETRLMARQGAERLALESPHFALPDLQRLAGRMWWLWTRLPAIRQVFPFDLMVVLGFEASEWAISIAERCAVPYLLLLEDEPIAERRIRASRHWCRALVAGDAQLADQLMRLYHVPPALIHQVEPASNWRGPAVEAGRPAYSLAVLGSVGAGGAAGLTSLLDALRTLSAEAVPVELVLDPATSDLSNLRILAQREGLEERLTVVDSLERDALFWSVLDLYVEPAIGARTRRSLRRARHAGITWISACDPGSGGDPPARGSGTVIGAQEPGALAHAIRAALQPVPERQPLRNAAAHGLFPPTSSPEALALAPLLELALEPSRRLRLRRDHAATYSP
jgi:hypothetical protein